MKNILQDLQFTFRQFNRNPSFTIVAILTLAVGIGANTAIFSVVDSVLLQPLPFAHSEELTQIEASSPFPKGWVREYQRRSQSFKSISGYTLNAESNLADFGVPDRALGSAVSINLFNTLGIHPAYGRFFVPSEENFGDVMRDVAAHRESYAPRAYFEEHFDTVKILEGYVRFFERMGWRASGNFAVSV